MFNIFVGGLAKEVTQQDLQDAFSAFGEVATVSIIKDKLTGVSRGFAFVEMASKDEGLSAIKGLHGKELKGKSLAVNEARPKTDNRGGGNSRGSGFGRGKGGYGQSSGGQGGYGKSDGGRGGYGKSNGGRGGYGKSDGGRGGYGKSDGGKKRGGKSW